MGLDPESELLLVFPWSRERLSYHVLHRPYEKCLMLSLRIRVAVGGFFSKDFLI
jgi:hypothetical protein